MGDLKTVKNHFSALRKIARSAKDVRHYGTNIPTQVTSLQLCSAAPEQPWRRQVITGSEVWRFPRWVLLLAFLFIIFQTSVQLNSNTCLPWMKHS